MQGPVLVVVQEVGHLNRPPTPVHVVKGEVSEFAGRLYNGQTFSAGTFVAVTFFHPSGWGSRT